MEHSNPTPTAMLAAVQKVFLEIRLVQLSEITFQKKLEEQM